ncbi:MAG: signal peptidase I [bacterium]
MPIRMFIAQPFIVSGSSMVPTFEDGQYLIVDEISYRFDAPKRDDVVVFKYPNDTTKFFIKRIIGPARRDRGQSRAAMSTSRTLSTLTASSSTSRTWRILRRTTRTSCSSPANTSSWATTDQQAPTPATGAPCPRTCSSAKSSSASCPSRTSAFFPAATTRANNLTA